MPKTVSDQPDEGDELDLSADSMGARCVRALFLKYKVPPRQFAPLVKDILGLSYSQARRKASGTGWSLEELKQVADRFDESLPDLVALCYDADWEDAVFESGGLVVMCRVRIGGELRESQPANLVAIKVDGGWSVRHPEGAIAPAGSFEVTKLLLEASATSASVADRKRVAVLDDDPDLVFMLGQHLREDGFEARTFTTLGQIEKAAAKERFDAFVLDWVVGSASARAFVEAQRQRAPNVPIIVLTGQEKAQHEVAEVLFKMPDLEFLSKPVAFPILTAKLRAKLDAPAADGSASSPPARAAARSRVAADRG